MEEMFILFEGCMVLLLLRRSLLLTCHMMFHVRELLWYVMSPGTP